ATIGFSDKDMRPEAYIENASTKAGAVRIIAATQSSRQETDGLEINISATVEVARYADGSRNWERALPALALVIAI
ncbi:MAG: sensor histidine kinase, partial [Mesorhizobium sp.]